MTEILGTPTELAVDVGRVLSDNNYGSFRGGAILTVSLAPDDNLKDVFDSVQAWLETNVGKAVKRQKAAYDQLQPAAENPYPGPSGPTNFPDDFDDTPQHTQTPVTAPNQPVAQSSGQMVTETWTNPVMTIEFTKGGDKYLRVRGGKWLKFGCPAWEETIPFTYFTDWEPGNEYRLPDGLQEVVVQMNEKGQPKKVIAFQ